MNQQINSDRQRGLYRSEFEHDNCGVGMVANLSGEASHDIVVSGVTILKRLLHRGATGNDPETGDGAGLLLKIPQGFFRKNLDEICGRKERKERRGKKSDAVENSASFAEKETVRKPLSAASSSMRIEKCVFPLPLRPVTNFILLPPRQI